MDLFRKLIGQIGNAMGYVRMVRSGALHECTEATVYLPEIDAELNFVNYATEDILGEASVKAAENLENDINNLCKNYHVDTNYFQLLVKVFIPYFRHSENIHLNNFYMIIPPLTINHVEYILKAKEKLTKKDKNGALFTDDGFAMGEWENLLIWERVQSVKNIKGWKFSLLFPKAEWFIIILNIYSRIQIKLKILKKR